MGDKQRLNRLGDVEIFAKGGLDSGVVMVFEGSLTGRLRVFGGGTLGRLCRNAGGRPESGHHYSVKAKPDSFG